MDKPYPSLAECLTKLKYLIIVYEIIIVCNPLVGGEFRFDIQYTNTIHLHKELHTPKYIQNLPDQTDRLDCS